MRKLRQIVRVALRVVVHGRHDVSVGSAVAPQPSQELAKGPFGRTGVAIFLNQDIDHVPVLIDGPPQVVSLSSDPHEDLV
jgi:hypothetical protein